MTEKNHNHLPSRYLLTILVSVFVFVIMMTPQQGFAATLSQTFAAPGTYDIFFRNPDSTDPTSDPVISFDRNVYHLGDAGTLTINDNNANVDRTVKDTISVTVGSQPVSLEETDVNSGIFTGQFTAGTSNTVNYNPNPPDSVRAILHVTTSNPDTQVTITDFTLPFNTCLGDSIATEGVTLSANDAITLEYISISYANAAIDLVADPLGVDVPPDHLRDLPGPLPMYAMANTGINPELTVANQINHPSAISKGRH